MTLNPPLPDPSPRREGLKQSLSISYSLLPRKNGAREMRSIKNGNH